MGSTAICSALFLLLLTELELLASYVSNKTRDFAMSLVWKNVCDFEKKRRKWFGCRGHLVRSPQVGACVCLYIRLFLSVSMFLTAVGWLAFTIFFLPSLNSIFVERKGLAFFSHHRTNQVWEWIHLLSVPLCDRGRDWQSDCTYRCIYKRCDPCSLALDSTVLSRTIRTIK